MPELYGIVRSAGLIPDDSGYLEKMRGDFPASRQARSESENLPWAVMGTVSSHDNDTIPLMRSEHPPSSSFWIGVFQKDNEKLELANVLASLQQHDVGYLQECDPPFAACICDSQSRTVWLISDPYGLHPIYYALHDGLLGFCTKMRPLLRSGVVEWQLDQQAVLDFFTYEHVTGNRTLADNVKVLPPGAILTFNNGHLRMESYLSSHEAAVSQPRSIRATSDRLYDELSSSVSRSLRYGRRAAITLSGGLDSRALLGCAAAQRNDVRTYTFGTPGCRDIAYAQELAHRCGVPHSVVNIEASFLPRCIDHGLFVTGGMVNCIHYHILSLADRLASDADVVLDGLGGDALTGSHLKWTMAFTRSVERAAEMVYHQRATAWSTREAREQLFTPEFLRQTDYDPKNAVYKHFENLAGLPPWVGCQRFDLGERQRRFIQYGPHLLRSQIAVQTPFYAPALVRLMAHVPVTHLIEQRAYLRMHSRHLPMLAGVPESARNIPVSWPSSIRFGKKVFDYCRRHLPNALHRHGQRAIPAPTAYAEWFRTPLRSFLEERLLSEHKGYETIIRRDAVESLLREHFQKTADHSIKLGCLLTFKLWCRSLAQNR